MPHPLNSYFPGTFYIYKEVCMNNKLKFLMWSKQSFIALFVLLAMVFGACHQPVGNNRRGSTPAGSSPGGSNPGGSNASDFTPMYFYVDSNGDFTETDTGRTVVVTEEKAEVVFYMDDIASSEQNVGIAFEDKNIIFFFEEGQNFPTKMVLSDSEESLNGYFTPYDPVTQAYSLVFEQDGDEEICLNIALSKNIFTQYKDDSGLTSSQNLRMRNLYIAMCIYTSLNDFITSNDTLQARGIKNFFKKVWNVLTNPKVLGSIELIIGVVEIAAGIYSTVAFGDPSFIYDGAEHFGFGIESIINGVNQQKDPSGTYVASTSVSLNKSSINLVVGADETLIATITPANAYKAVGWASSNYAVATVASNGTVIGLGAGTATITVITLNGGKTASCIVNVNTVPVTGVSLNKSSLSLVVGATEPLVPTVMPANATDKTITWKSSNTSVATVSNTGMVSGISVGSATITVTTSNGGKTASCTVTVNPVRVTGVTMNKTSTAMLVDGNETLTYTIRPANATNKNVTWSSSNTSVATVSNSGLVTGVSAGTADIIVITADGGYNHGCTVTVSASVVNVTGVSLDKTSASTAVASTVTLIPTIVPTNSTNQSVTWSSNNTAVATVSNSGLVTGVSAGTATITVTTSNAGKTASCTVIVYQAFSMVWIPGGTFTMGSPTSEPDRFSYETQHQVTLTKGFYMGKYPVTQTQYQAVIGSNPSSFFTSSGGDNPANRPVERVSWYDAIVFCNKLSMSEGLSPAYRISGNTDPAAWGSVPTNSSTTWDAVTIVAGSNGYRLPTEAQWEYACRAGTTTPFSTGNNITTSQANYDGNFPYNNNAKGEYRQRTTPVGSFAPNSWGLYDMHGNVLEWCWDWFGTYASGAQTDPTGAVSGDVRVLRGGSWNGSGRILRSAFRSYNPSYRINSYGGFRLSRP
jgi:uncharacterized protein YjdB